jgi:hypothetical protein
LLEGGKTSFLKSLPISFQTLLNVAEAWVACEQNDVAVAQRDEVARSLSTCSSIVGGNTIKVGVPADAVQEHRGNTSFPQVLQDRRIVTTGDQDETVDLTLNEGADPISLG